MEVIIRQYSHPEDYPLVLDVWAHMEKGVRVGPSDSKTEIEKKLERDPDLFLIAEVNGLITGTVLGGFDGRRGTIYHLSVLAEYRQRGIASKLLTELEARLLQKGCIKSYLLVNADNVEVFDFYARRGWVRTDNVIFSKEFK